MIGKKVEEQIFDAAQHGAADCMKIVECEKKHKKHQFISTGKIIEVDGHEFAEYKCRWCPLYSLES